MATVTTTCQYTRGFTEIHVVDPQPGESPQVLKGTCLGPCGEIRYFDRKANIYRCPADAYNGKNAERRRSI